jgi:hypothetical protein
VVALDDWKEENRKSIWYDSRFYRMNMLWENGGFYIRDVHCFDETVLSPTHDAILKTASLAYGTLPLMDGALWSGTEKAGMWPVMISDDGKIIPMTIEGSPVIKQLNKTDISVSQPIRDGGKMTIVCHEADVTFTGVDAQGKPLHWALDLLGGREQGNLVQDVSTNRILYDFGGVSYQLVFPRGAGSSQRLTTGAIRITAANSGKLIMSLVVRP